MIEHNDDMTITAEDGALLFTTRKEWESIPESRLSELSRYTVADVFKGTTGVYFLLDAYDEHNIDKCKCSDPLLRYLLVRICIDEEWKTSFYKMEVSTEEGQHIKNTDQFTLWD